MITIIDDKEYKVRLLTGGNQEGVDNEWDTLMDAFQENNELLHWKHIYSLCQENGYNLTLYRVRRGFSSARFWGCSYASRQGVFLGFRPVLEPLETDTLSTIIDGSILQFGTLYMDDVALANPKIPIWDGDIPDYVPNTMLQIGDTSSDEERQIRWVKWRNILVADRNILKNISWEKLNTFGFAGK